MTKKEFGLRLARARQSKEISAYELSLRIGKDTSYLYKVEAGNVNISYTVLCDICNVLGINPKELF